MKIRRVSSAAVLVPLLVVVIAGCGASGSSGKPEGTSRPSGSTPASRPASGTSTQQASSIHPGHGTPADAVDGYLQALLAGNATLACSYLSSNSGSCPATVQATGSFTIGRTVVNPAGTYALVEVTGKICISGHGCSSNSDPSTGMPTGKETVDQAMADDAVTGNGFSPMICISGTDGGWDISVNLS
jgi:hypothetical protein